MIFLTAHAHTAARVEGLDAGAVDYIVKPFEHPELTARVRAALRTKTVRDVLATEAATDALTGLLNRSQLGPSLDGLVAAARRFGRPLGCLMADIDHFKALNDAHGHLAGDQVLREVAARFRAGQRESDVLVRFGGEEFLALLPETDALGARTLAERLRVRIGGSPIAIRPEVGGFLRRPGSREHRSRLLERAHERRRHARRGSRRRPLPGEAGGPRPRRGPRLGRRANRPSPRSRSG